MNDAHEKLATCVERINAGPWRFVQLRGQALSSQVIDGGDVDLLGTRASCLALFDAVYGWVQQGECHARMVVSGTEKAKLLLFSTDGKHQADFDLWMELRQIFNRQAVLLPEACLSVAVPQSEAIGRLPVDLEVCVYVHHVVSKRRLGRFTDEMRSRFAFYRDHCNDAALRGLLDEAIANGMVTEELIRHADQVLKGRPELYRMSRPGLWAKLCKARLAPPRSLKWLSLMGGDGCGKTTMGKALVVRLAEMRAKLFTGKHLYRKNLFYKALVIFVRPLLFQSRERFDDLMSPLVYVLACIRLRLKLCLASSDALVLMDRSLVDFLVCNRKGDHPGFGRREWLTRWMGCRIPTVHFIVSYERLAERKQEMTKDGICRYNQEMFRHFTRRIPTDYMLFNNSGSLEDSLEALTSIIKCSYKKS